MITMPDIHDDRSAGGAGLVAPSVPLATRLSRSAPASIHLLLPHHLTAPAVDCTCPERTRHVNSTRGSCAPWPTSGRRTCDATSPRPTPSRPARQASASVALNRTAPASSDHPNTSTEGPTS